MLIKVTSTYSMESYITFLSKLAIHGIHYPQLPFKTGSLTDSLPPTSLQNWPTGLPVPPTSLQNWSGELVPTSNFPSELARGLSNCPIFPSKLKLTLYTSPPTSLQYWPLFVVQDLQLPFKTGIEQKLQPQSPFKTS